MVAFDNVQSVFDYSPLHDVDNTRGTASTSGQWRGKFHRSGRRIDTELQYHYITGIHR